MLGLKLIHVSETGARKLWDIIICGWNAGKTRWGKDAPVIIWTFLQNLYPLKEIGFLCKEIGILWLVYLHDHNLNAIPAALYSAVYI